MNFHNDEWIMARLQEHYNEALTLFPEDRIVGLFLQGSQNYGLDVPGSDIDTKLIVTPTWDDICFNRKPVSITHHRANDEHIDIKDVRLYMNTFRKQNINFIEILFTPYFILNPIYAEYWELLLVYRESIAHYNTIAAVRAMKGIALEKYHAMEHRYPSKIDIIDKFGYDPKQLYHLFRVREFERRFINGELYRECLISRDTEFFKEVKLGKYTLEEARKQAKIAVEDIESMTNIYVEKVSKDFSVDPSVDVVLDAVQDSIMKKAIKLELKV